MSINFLLYVLMIFRHIYCTFRLFSHMSRAQLETWKILSLKIISASFFSLYLFNIIHGSITNHHHKFWNVKIFEKRRRKSVEDLTLQGPSSADPVSYFCIYSINRSCFSLLEFLGKLYNFTSTLPCKIKHFLSFDLRWVSWFSLSCSVSKC